MAATISSIGRLGLSESELRHELERELMQAIRAEGQAPTVHAIAHSIARVLAHDHLRIAEQLQEAGMPLGEPRGHRG